METRSKRNLEESGILPKVTKKTKTQKKNSRSRSRSRSSSHKRRAKFLSAICSDAHVCLAFGRYSDEIKKHFGGFTSFKHVVPPIKRIGENSENGFVNQIEYDHRGYKSYAILKSAKTVDADNLLYEFVVGQYINRMNKQFPCFLETYGFYRYNNEASWTEMQNTPVLMDISGLKNDLQQQKTIDYNDACRESKHLAILIQYFKDIVSLDVCSHNSQFIQEELMNALFQLYIPLVRMKDNFTHYDLHLSNVYLYQPVAHHFIEFHYWITSTRSITFKSSYMLKIIDYGRSYFKDDETGSNSKDIYEKELCENAVECNEPREFTGECGDHVGFGWFEKNGQNPEKNYYICAQKKNISHDLLPLSRIKKNNTLPHLNHLTTDLNDLVSKVIYTDSYGTKENINTGYPHAILNIEDAAKFIMGYVTSKKYQDINNQVYHGKTKLGDLHIFLDGKKPMRFEAAK